MVCQYLIAGKALVRTALHLLLSSCKLDIDKVDFELLVCLDADEHRRAASTDDDLIWVVDRLEYECESSFLRAHVRQ